MRRKPWMITQQWEDVLFLHWPVQPQELKQYIPQELELDLYENKAWLSFVLFKVKGNRLRFTPSIPGVSSFLQLNVRTYVTCNGKKGVYFFNLDANNAFIVQMTTIGHLLPYRRAKMTVKKEGNTFSFTSSYQNLKAFEEKLMVTFEPMPVRIESHAFERWLVERYHLWTKMKTWLLRIDNYHSPWRLQKVNVVIHHNTMAPFIKGLTSFSQPIVHYSKSKKAKISLPVLETKKVPNH
ncbi:YqjF family protein [Lysinibacillus sp. NPDC097287]|uniref:YqjF family protein n=1 Tax=Lysinibacillus sp. NPDC097287 TaxID=3364144 RepID=UPI00382CE30C